MGTSDTENNSEFKNSELSSSKSDTEIMVANIRYLMGELGINQKQLAERAKIGQSVLSNYMSGRNGAHQENLKKIAVALGVTAAQLMQPMATDAAPTSLVQEPAAEFTLMGRYDKLFAEQVQLRFVPHSAYGSFVAGCQDRSYGEEEFERRWVKKEPGKDYSTAYLLEIRGNSMAPRYPNGARYVVRPVSDGNWQYAQGVHALSLRGAGEGEGMFIIKRIKSNKNGVLLLASDNNDQEMTVLLGDILCMWKVGEADYLPEED